MPFRPACRLYAITVNFMGTRVGKDNQCNFKKWSLQLETFDEAEEQCEQLHAELPVRSKSDEEENWISNCNSPGVIRHRRSKRIGHWQYLELFMYAWMRVGLCKCVCMCVYVCVHACVYIYMHVFVNDACMCVYFLFMCVCMYVFKHVCIFVCMCLWMSVCMCV